MPKSGKKPRFLTLFLILGLIPAIVLGASLIVFQLSLQTKGLPHDQKGYERAAQKVFAKCSKATIKRTCYEKAFTELLDEPDNFTMEEAFKIVDILHQRNRELVYCHDIGHFLSAKETKKDPSKWTDVIARCPSGVCGNGCIHGALQQRFGVEELSDSQITKNMSTLKTVCDIRPGWKPAGVE